MLRCLLASLGILLVACGGGDGRDAGSPDSGHDDAPPFHEFPRCTAVAGVPVVTHSPDRGATLRPNSTLLSTGPSMVTQSVVAPWGAFGHTLFASRGTEVFVSTDAGCSWRWLADSPEPLRLREVPAAARAFGVSSTGDRWWVYDRNGLVEDAELPFTAVEVVPGRSHLFALSDDGRILRHAESWQEFAALPADPRRPSALSVDERVSGEHLIVTYDEGPPAVSMDGGASWIVPTGVVADADEVHTGRVWVGQGIYGFSAALWMVVDRTLDGATSRVVQLSGDGGAMFSDVIAGDAGLSIPDGPFVSWQDELWFPVGHCPGSEPGLVHYRAESGALVVRRWSQNESLGIASLALHPNYPDHIHLGHHAVAPCG